MQFRFVNPGDLYSRPATIMLHGSAGNEMDMLPLAAAAPGTGVLSIQGAVSWEGIFDFFKRQPDRGIDGDSIRAEASALGRFISYHAAEH